MTDLLRKCNYDIIFVPLYEGGHYQHDMTNFIVSRACIKSGTKSLLYECPEYNAFYSLKNTDCITFEGTYDQLKKWSMENYGFSENDFGDYFDEWSKLVRGNYEV